MERDLERLASKAQLLASQGRLDEALKIVKAFLLRNPKAGRAWRTLAGLHFLHGDLEEAVEAGAKCLEFTPEDQEAWTNQATYLMALKRPKEALAACDRCLALGPHPRALANRKDILAALGQEEEGSLSDGEAQAVEDPRPELKRVESLLAEGKTKEGEAAIREVARKFKTHPEALQQLAEYAGGAGIDLVHQLCDQALKQDPEHADSWFTKAKAYRGKGDNEKALECAQKGLAIEKNGQAYRLQADTLLALGRADEALESYDQACQLEPEDWVAWANRGEALVRLKKLGEAVASYDKALEIQPEDATLKKNREAVVKRKRTFEAKTVVRTEPPVPVKATESVAERQAKGLVVKAAEAGPEKGLAIAAQIKELAGYGSSKSLQRYHAEALIKLSAIATDYDQFKALVQAFVALEFATEDAQLGQQHLDAMVNAIAEEAPVHHLRKMSTAFKLLPDYRESNDIQRAHARALSSAAGKAGPFAGKLADSISAIPHYGKDETIQYQRARALASASAHASAGQMAVKTAQSVATLSFYNDSDRIREVHAEALCNAAVASSKASVADELAGEIAEIAGFAESEEMQKLCAQALAAGCQAAQKSKVQAQAFRDRIQGLPLYSRSSAIQLIYKETEQLVEGPTEQESEEVAEISSVELPRPAPKPRQKGMPKAAATLLVVLAVGFLFLFIGKEVYTQVTLRTQPQGGQQTGTNETFEEQMKLAEKAFKNGNFELAEGFARTARDVARASEHKSLIPRAYVLLARIYAGSEEWDKLGSVAESLEPAKISTLVDEWMAGELDPKRARAIEVLAQKLENKDELLAKVAEVYRDSNPLEAARILEANGELVKAYELAKKAGSPERELELLTKLVEKDPKYKSELMKAQNAKGAEFVKQAEAALAAEKAKQAESLANDALATMKGAEGSEKLQSRAQTVLAKLAYYEGEFRQALVYAKEAARLDPNADTKQRLREYRETDARTITRDELDPKVFKFVKPQQGDVAQTYLYYLTSKGCPVGRGTEKEFPPDDVGVTAYPQTITFQGKTPTGRVISTLIIDSSFTRKPLAPGTLEPFRDKSPITLDIGSKKCHRTGKVVIHEVEWRKEKLVRFSADFFIACESAPDRPTYGKIRYRSKIR